jgi:hypothetical protein
MTKGPETHSAADRCKILSRLGTFATGTSGRYDGTDCCNRSLRRNRLLLSRLGTFATGRYDGTGCCNRSLQRNRSLLQQIVHTDLRLSSVQCASLFYTLSTTAEHTATDLPHLLYLERLHPNESPHSPQIQAPWSQSPGATSTKRTHSTDRACSVPSSPPHL